MIPSVPLPKLRHLITPAREAAVPLHLWESSQTDRGFLLSRSAFSLNLLVEARKALMSRSDVTVMLPTWFCNQSTAPMRMAGANLVFYPVDLNGAPDWDWCSGYAQDNPPDLFLLVHPFGWANDAGRTRRLCDEWGSWLIEDAAHILGPSEAVGQHGDAVLYSPHKSLPLPDGAILVSRSAQLTSYMEQALKTPEIRKSVAGSWKLKRLIQLLVPGILLNLVSKRTALPGFDDDPVYIEPEITPLASELAQNLMGTAPSSFKTAQTLRSENAARMAKLLENAKGLTLFRPLKDSRSGYRLALRFDTTDNARAFFTACRTENLPVETWPDMPPEAMIDPERFETALILRNRVLYLQTHQSLDMNDVKRRLVKVLKHIG